MVVIYLVLYLAGSFAIALGLITALRWGARKRGLLPARAAGDTSWWTTGGDGGADGGGDGGCDGGGDGGGD